jgi:enoyl-CoA hydratase/carnithine racemase
MAAEDAQIGLTETRLGAIPGAGGSQRLPRLVGISQALFMMYAGDPIDGKRAREIGLVNYCAPRSKLENVAAEYIATLTSRSSATAQTLKRVVHRGMQMPLADALEYERQALLSIFGSPDYAEGLAAFAEKRAPRFLL